MESVRRATAVVRCFLTSWMIAAAVGCERSTVRIGAFQPSTQSVTSSEVAPDAAHGPLDAPRTPAVQRVESMGITVTCTLTPVSASEPRDVIYAGDDVEVRFDIRDTTTGSPIANLNPAAWIDAPDPRVTEDCQQLIQSFLTGSLSARAEHDLNVFYVLALNDEPSITVVDPLFSYGGTRLLALVRLPSPGEDWYLNASRDRLFVTMPLINQVAVVDTARWEVIQRVNVGMHPTRIMAQPDEKYLWVSCVAPPGSDPKGQVTVIDTRTLDVEANLSIGAGVHDIAFSTDSTFAFVTSSDSARVSVIDIQTLKATATSDLAANAGGVVFSAMSGCAYVTEPATGSIVVIDGRTHEPVKHIAARPGLGTIRVAPGDRYVFVANEKENAIDIIDVASGRIVDTADVGPEPDQIVFTLNLAYIRSRGSEIILMIPLDQIGKDGPLSVIDFTGGHTPFGLFENTSLADGMAPAPSGLAIVLSNPVDKSIYYYREGMAAPMGEFSNYGRIPRAVLVVDRSLNESSPGAYTTSANLSRSGWYNVAFLLDTPRVVHCFELTVSDPPGSSSAAPNKPVRIAVKANRKQVVVGESFKVTYTVTDALSHEPVNNLRDLGVIAFSSTNWQMRKHAVAVDDGTYEVAFTPPDPGVYYTFCMLPSSNMEYRDSPSVVITVQAKE